MVLTKVDRLPHAQAVDRSTGDSPRSDAWVPVDASFQNSSARATPASDTRKTTIHPAEPIRSEPIQSRFDAIAFPFAALRHLDKIIAQENHRSSPSFSHNSITIALGMTLNTNRNS
jgi:hypothetical protein